MDYEELYESLQPLGKNLKESANAVGKYQKAVLKDADSGNLADMKKDLTALREAASLLLERIHAYEAETAGFDTGEYFMSGDFTRQLLEACEAKNVDVKGEKGIYEMFPFKVRVAAESEEVYMNRKKVNSVRPSFVAETVRAGQEKLNKAAFKAAPFMGELAEAYDVTCLKAGARIGSDQMLTKIYKNLAPMARARKEYDMQAFAFDLARLYEAGAEEWKTKSGRVFSFGTSRDGKTGIRVLSRGGTESYILTLKALNTQDDQV